MRYCYVGYIGDHCASHSSPRCLVLWLPFVVIFEIVILKPVLQDIRITDAYSLLLSLL